MTKSRLSRSRLAGLIADATVDAYTESEQRAGFCTMIGECLAMPFTTRVLGVEVTVAAIDQNDAEEIVALCTRGRSRQSIPALDLPLPSPAPEGAEWIEAYRFRVRGGR